MVNRITLTCLGALWLATLAVAQDNDPAEYGDRPIHATRAKEMHQANLVKHRKATDILVLPGLVADRKNKRVEVVAEATGIAPKEIVEFLLIDAKSGKGYEALLWSHAKPSDIHRALEFIGMKSGEPFHPAKLRFWPKGERVVASVSAARGGARRRLESLVVDTSTGRSLPEVGFVFTGSLMVNSSSKPGDKAYAADVIDPKAVASIYNDTTAVLDVPRRALRGEVYGKQLAGSDHKFAKHELLTITLEPEYKDERKRVINLTLNIRPASKKAPTAEAASLPVEFMLTDGAGKVLTKKPQLADTLGAFGTLVREGHDPHVSVRFASSLQLAEVGRVCKFLDAIDSDKGIRVDPPSAGQLYYEAFLPDRQLLRPESRIIDPWEIHLEGRGEKITAKLRLVESRYIDGKSKREETSFDIETPADLRRQLDADAAKRKEAGRRRGPPVLLVFANADLTYGQLLEYLTPAMTTHNTIHLFLGPRQ